jgi:nucleoside 2-deoxyribosyltransferase
LPKRNLYLAGPLFNPSERDEAVRISTALSVVFNVYLPHLDGSLLPNLLKEGLEAATAKRKIFAEDIEALRRSEVFFINLNGRTIDEGAAFELGVAWCLGKPCFGYKDDFRQLTLAGDNPMIEGALEKLFYDSDQLLHWLAEIRGQS